MKTLALVMGLSVVLVGCADQKHWDKYYALQTQQTDAIINSVERQTTANASQQVTQMSFFGTAAVNAAKTVSTTDDVLIAFAWGYKMGQPMKVELPNLRDVVAPDKHSDIVRAWTPIIGMAAPFLYPLAYGWSSSSSSGDSAQIYQLQGDGDLTVNSQNTGSQNYKSAISSSGAYTNQFKQESNCITGECDEDGNVVNPLLPGDPGYSCSPGEMITPTCSCATRQAGGC